MAITKLQSESLNLADDYTFTGNITGHMTPAWSATIDADTNITTGAVFTKTPFDEEEFDTDGAYDHSTNYRFTVPTGKGGKYFVTSVLRFETAGDSRLSYLWNSIYVNGSSNSPAIANHTNFGNSAGLARSFTAQTSGIIDLSAGDYLEVYYAANITAGTPFLDKFEGGDNCRFMGFRISN